MATSKRISRTAYKSKKDLGFEDNKSIPIQSIAGIGISKFRSFARRKAIHHGRISDTDHFRPLNYFGTWCLNYLSEIINRFGQCVILAQIGFRDGFLYVTSVQQILPLRLAVSGFPLHFSDHEHPQKLCS